MKVERPFRLKHIGTGLYYCPLRQIQVRGFDGKTHYVKSNLSKRGKVYFTNPLKHIKEIDDHTKLVEKDYCWGNQKWYCSTTVKVSSADFEFEYLDF